MTTYRTRVTVPEDRRITLELPPDMPTGEAEVTVSVERADRPGSGAALLKWLRERPDPPPGWHAPSRTEIDEYLRSLRAEWDA